MDKPEIKSESAGEQKQVKPGQMTFAKSLSIALQFAFIVLLPLLVFGLTGKWLANKYENKFWLIGGLILALTITTLWFYRKITDLSKDFLNK